MNDNEMLERRLRLAWALYDAFSGGDLREHSADLPACLELANKLPWHLTRNHLELSLSSTMDAKDALIAEMREALVAALPVVERHDAGNFTSETALVRCMRRAIAKTEALK